MRLYLVFGQPGIGYRAALQYAQHRDLLESFSSSLVCVCEQTKSLFKDAKQAIPMNDRKALEPADFRFFLDSGAFAAWKRGAEVDIDEYIEFVRANIENIDVCATLDVIPGVPGRQRSPTETEAAAEQSWRNYLYMRDSGLEPLPVYHYGEHRRHLDRMLDAGCDYIGIGGLVGTGTETRVRFLDELFDYLTDDAGRPCVRLHGFGVTTISLIFDYPWYSVDSTTWVRNAMNGTLILPRWDAHEQFVFNRLPAYVVVAERAQRATGKNGWLHGARLSVEARRVVDKWTLYCGTDYTSCVNSYLHRSLVNVTFFREVARARRDPRFERKQIRQQRFLA